jgi:hypothetical protein
MINPLNGDKTLSPAMERSVESRKQANAERTAPAPAEQHNEPSASATVEVDQARQLYNVEHQASRPVSGTVDSPEAAGSLLNAILQQFSDSPEQAFRTQAANVSPPLVKLLEQAPA